MNEFEELDLPKEANLGWYIVSMFGIMTYLHNDGQMHKGTQDSYYASKGYFETEYDAHKCAERYYLTHSRKYPYTTLLNRSQKVNERSQIMNFGDKK